MLKAILRLSTITIGIGCLFPAMLASAQTRGTETIFVMSNNADKNQVTEFVQNSDGTVVAKETFDTHGRGTGGVNDPLESQGSLTLSADHSLLFAANAGSGDITVFQVVGGRLIFLNRQPSGGGNPVAIAQSQNRVYVLNQAALAASLASNWASVGNWLPLLTPPHFFLPMRSADHRFRSAPTVRPSPWWSVSPTISIRSTSIRTVHWAPLLSIPALGLEPSQGSSLPMES